MGEQVPPMLLEKGARGQGIFGNKRQGRRAFKPRVEAGMERSLHFQGEMSSRKCMPALPSRSRKVCVRPIQTEARELEGPVREERAVAVGLIGSNVELMSRHPQGVSGVASPCDSAERRGASCHGRPQLQRDQSPRLPPVSFHRTWPTFAAELA